MEVYDGIIQGLEEATLFKNGKIKAKTISISSASDFETTELKKDGSHRSFFSKNVKKYIKKLY